MEGKPCLDIRTGDDSNPYRAKRIKLTGPSELVYSPEDPKPYGATLWLQTENGLMTSDDGELWSKMERREMVILIASNDEYVRAFGKVWLDCFRTYWADCPWNPVFCTPTYTDPRLPIITVGKDLGWNRNAREALHHIKRLWMPDTVLLLHEDFLIGPPSRVGAHTQNIRRCLEILKKDPSILTIGLVHKDPETKPYEGWPEMLGWHDVQTTGVLPVDPAGISLWRTSALEDHIEEVIRVMPPEKDFGRQGVVEFSFYGAEWARKRNDKHLRVKRAIDYKDGILNILFGVTIEQGKLKIRDQQQLALVEFAVGGKLDDIEEVKPLLGGKELGLGKQW